jgi:hypothetical protein
MDYFEGMEREWNTVGMEDKQTNYVNLITSSRKQLRVLLVIYFIMLC